jgi:hypothetical protein
VPTWLELYVAGSISPAVTKVGADVASAGGTTAEVVAICTAAAFALFLLTCIILVKMTGNGEVLTHFANAVLAFRRKPKTPPSDKGDGGSTGGD